MKRCAYLSAQPDADGKVRLRKNSVYPCTCPLPVMPALPASITKSSVWHAPADVRRMFVSPDECARCPCFTTGDTP